MGIISAFISTIAFKPTIVRHPLSMAAKIAAKEIVHTVYIFSNELSIWQQNHLFFSTFIVQLINSHA